MNPSIGDRFENEIRGVIEGIIAEKYEVFAPRVLSKPKVPGRSSEWDPDIEVVAESAISGEYSIHVAIIECKYIGEKSSPGVYWTEMSRAYMELNDLRLNPGLEDAKFYLVVNRYHEGVRRNYPEVFKSIGVEMINFYDTDERARFEEQLRQRLGSVSFEEQSRRIKEVLGTTSKGDAAER